MSSSYKSLLILSYVFALASQGVAQPLSIDESPPALRITVFVHDYALVSGRTATRARNVATDILRRAGLEPEWRWPALSERDAVNVPPLGPAGLALRILPASMTPALPVSSRTFGVAFPFSQRGFGVASILFQRVDQLASRKVISISRGLILGHVMAHEIGHLLLGRNSHSAEGIMQMPWDRPTLRRATRGELTFTPQQAKQLRAAVVARAGSAYQVIRGFEGGQSLRRGNEGQCEASRTVR